MFQSVVIGRAAEMDRLRRLLGLAQEGRGQVALISGEAGIGKTRLVAEAKATAAEMGFSILQGNCFEPDRTLPYAPLLDILHTFVANCSQEEAARALDRWAPMLTNLLPEIGAILPGIAPAPLPPPERAKNYLFFVLEQFLTHLAETCPLILVVEDLHWSDETSLGFLIRLSRQVVPRRILLLLTYRIEDTNTSLTSFLANLHRERMATELPLVRLTHSETDAMLRAAWRAEQPLNAELLNNIFTLTEGNPFFIEEVIKTLLAQDERRNRGTRQGFSLADQIGIPHTVQLAVQQRVDQLSPASRKILLLAALVGRRFDFTLVQKLSGQDADGLLVSLRELFQAQLIIEESADRYAFRHALTREAVYVTLLARERQQYHRVIGLTFEQLYADQLDSHLADLAYHFSQAGEWTKALSYAQSAGERARLLYAPREAAELFSRALEASGQINGSAPIALLRARGQSYETVGAFDLARHDYEQALHVAHDEGDAPSEWQSLLDLGFLWVSRDYQAAGEYFRRASDAARLLGNVTSLAQTLNRLGNWHLNMEQPLKAKQHHTEALTLFEQSNDHQGLAATLDLLGLTTGLTGELVDSNMYYERATALFRELGDRRGLASSLAIQALLSSNYLMDASAVAALPLSQAVHLGEEAIDTARQIEWRSGEALGLITSGACLGSMGQYGQALDNIRQAVVIAEEIDHHQWAAFALIIQGSIYLDIGAVSAADQSLDSALTLAVEINSPYWTRLALSFLALVYIHENEREQAAAALSRAEEPDARLESRAQKTCHAIRLKLALSGGDFDDAYRLGSQLLEAVMTASPESRQPGQGVPRLLMWYGETLTGLKRYPQAESTLIAALQVAEAQGALPLVWRSHRALARLYRAQRHFDASEYELLAAQAIVEHLAATLQDDALRQTFQEYTLADLPLQHSSRREAKRAFDGLTRREQEIAALVGQGRSNREIATALTLSERTVETHISNILTKLGFVRRAQIIAWAVEKGLAAP